MAGLAIGMAAGAAVGVWASSLFQAGPAVHAAVAAGTTLVVAGAAVGATVGPVRRAIGTDLSSVLRDE